MHSWHVMKLIWVDAAGLRKLWRCIGCGYDELTVGINNVVVKTSLRREDVHRGS
jgi:hypothetical protein